MPGILPRAMADIFRRKAEMEHDYEVNIKTYMLELYNDQLLDLLVVHGKNSSGGKKTHLDIKKDSKGMIFVAGATIKECPNLKALQDLWAVGESNRHVGATKMNAGSSRSHLIISILIETKDRATGKVSVRAVFNN